MGKVLLIGIDGGNIELIERWKDELPTFNKLMKKGAYGKLESVIPPATVPAWNCLFAGKNPGKLGLYDFVTLPFYRSGGLRVADYLYQDSPSLWDILGDFGKKVQIINVPVAFPPKKVNGLMVSGGILSPLYRNVDYTYPAGLKKELDKIVGGYDVLPFTDLTIPNKEEEYLKKFEENIDKHVAAVKYLSQKYEWDFLTYVFQVTDLVQHYCWHHMDESHPKHDPQRSTKYKDAIKSVYKRVDAGIADLLEVISKDTNVLIVSDHGSGPLYGYFLVNEWLRRKGLLSFKRQNLNLKNIAKAIALLLKNLFLKYNIQLSQFLLNKLPIRMLKPFLAREMEKGGAMDLLKRIDWSHTKAYGLGGDGSIFINLKGREPNGTVNQNEYEKLRQEISELLREVRDPITKRKVLTAVFNREEIYAGKHVKLAPDLLFILDHYRYVQRAGIGHNRVWIEAEISGGHGLYGIFLACGPNIKAEGKLRQKLKIYDIAPTILHLMSLPIPKQMDGEVLMELFAPESEPSKRSIVYQKIGERQRIREKINKLRQLGIL